MVCWHRAELSKPAGPHLAQKTSTADPVDRIDQDSVAYLPVVYARPKSCNVAGEVDTHNAGHRHLNPGHATAREDVMVVQTRRLHTHKDLAGCWRGVGKACLVSDRTRTTVLIDDCCLHGLVLCLCLKFSFCRTPTSAPSRSGPAPCGRSYWWWQAAVRLQK